jgi:Bacterial protein of unknown function (DUF885)
MTSMRSFLPIVLCAAVAACAASARPNPTARDPAARSAHTEGPALTPIARSDADAHILLEALARFLPEQFGQLGFPGLDTEIRDLRPRVNERFRDAIRGVIARLEPMAARENDPYVGQDLAILLKAARDADREAVLEEQYLLPFEDVNKAIFEGIHGLLDDQVPAERRVAAVVRLRRYAGLEPGFEPITKLAIDRSMEKLSRRGLLGPVKGDVDKALANASVYRDGLDKLFAKYALPGYAAPLSKLRSDLEGYDAFVRSSILPRARADFREPPALYAFKLQEHGVLAEPEALAREAHEAFAKTQEEMQVLAPAVAREKGLGSTDYREVLRALKRDQVLGDALPRLYHQRIGDLEEIIRRERLVTLPARPMRFRIATEAETAASPAPHVDVQGLFAKNVELAFVLPLALPPAAGRPALQYDDFTFAAASWTLTAHEGRPGHELQFSAMAERGLSLARTLFAFNAVNVEGWGLYSEAIARPFMPPDGKLASLQALLLREARAFLDPELQMGKTTIEQARRVLVDDVVQSEASATQELDRYTFDSPGQATSYFYGYERLLELRAHVEHEQGARFDARAFHDFVLAQGLLPPPLLRAAVDKGFLRTD